MKLLVTTSLILLGIGSGILPGDVTQERTKSSLPADTIIGRKEVVEQTPGTITFKRAVSYFMIVGGDTSEYSCNFSEAKEGGKVSIHPHVPYYRATMTYKQRLAEMRAILPVAAKEFNFDSLLVISYGRLVSSGDLAIEVTKQYRKKFGIKSKPENYGATMLFLKDSQLGTDLNALFKPYSVQVREVFIEKLFFATKKALYTASKIELDSAKAPDKILDCSLWIGLKKQ